MKITLRTGELQKKLSFVTHAISTKNPLPILSTFLLEAKGNILTLKSTDLEIGIETHIPIIVEDEGAIALPARLFNDLMQSLPEEEVSISTKELSCEIKTKKTKSILQGMEASDFPMLYDTKGDRIAELAVSDLKHYFSCVVFAASSDMSRPALSGIMVKPEESGLLLVATDGYRLSLKHHLLPKDQVPTMTGQEILIPARVFREVIGLKDEGESVSLYIAKNNNQVLFEQTETIVVGRLIEAQFPAYEKIIPADFSLSAVFDREEMLRAVRICAVFARDAANIIKLSLKKDNIIVSSQTPSLGENSVEVEARMNGEENDIAFNAKYLLDVLGNMTDETVTFEMTGPLNPGVFRIKDDTSFLHLIMPIRMQS